MPRFTLKTRLHIFYKCLAAQPSGCKIKRKQKMNSYTVLLYYKYINVDDPESIRDDHFTFCGENDIKGRIFLSNEGINGTVSGKKDNIKKYKEFLRSYREFSDILFKEDNAAAHAFKKLYVRVKPEIVTSGLNVSLKNGGKRLTPEQLKEFYDSGREFIPVDARNWYESRIGRFKNAVTPGLENFRDWRNTAEELRDHKDKTIVTYCTGGIRCEKASAYLIEQGFKDVYQLDGGIISYIKKFPDTYWEGSVFVFDERRLVEVNSSPELKHISNCHFCGKPTSYYINCHNQDCDRLLISCHECKTANEYCCSDECRNAPNKRKYFHG